MRAVAALRQQFGGHAVQVGGRPVRRPGRARRAELGHRLDPATDMHLRRLAVADFRSWERAELELEPGVTVLVGPNGVGKTNLVEAAGYLATLGSHRVATDAPLIRRGAERAVVRGAGRAPRPRAGRRAGDHRGPGQPGAGEPGAGGPAARRAGHPAHGAVRAGGPGAGPRRPGRAPPLPGRPAGRPRSRGTPACARTTSGCCGSARRCSRPPARRRRPAHPRRLGRPPGPARRGAAGRAAGAGRRRWPPLAAEAFAEVAPTLGADRAGTGYRSSLERRAADRCRPSWSRCCWPRSAGCAARRWSAGSAWSARTATTWSCTLGRGPGQGLRQPRRVVGAGAGAAAGLLPAAAGRRRGAGAGARRRVRRAGLAAPAKRWPPSPSGPNRCW